MLVVDAEERGGGNFTCVDHDTAHGGSVPTDPFCGAVDYNVCTMIDRTDEVSWSISMCQLLRNVRVKSRNIPPIPNVLSTMRGTP